MVNKVLVVGAGGIGCELLKNLILSDFNEIHLIDLDTIDISNLNRQFLFRKTHVGKSKALVAAETVKVFNKSVAIIPYHKSIFDSQFSQSFYRQFDLVFGALDNHNARKHLNRMCIAAKVDLIESGTAGYQGQVEPFIFSNSEERTNCYECKSRDIGKKTYPTCTIRNTPSEPVHCVVWSKNLFVHLFGEPDEDDEDFSPDFKDPELENADTTHTNRPCDKNDKSKSNIWENLECPHEELNIDQKVSFKVWNSDIHVLKNMSSLWDKKKSRKEPKCLEVDFLKNSLDSSFICDKNVLKDHQIVGLENWLYLFHDSCKRLRKRIGLNDSSLIKTTSLIWDKDDEDAMDFVASASIIRCHLFHIEKGYNHSIFDIKQIAGAIIPAISTANAIIAGIMVLQAKKIIEKVKPISEVYLKPMKRVIEPSRKKGPNPQCLICSKGSTNTIHMIMIKDSESFILSEIVDDILIRILGMSEPEIYYVKKGTILYSADPEDSLEGNLKKFLKDFCIDTKEETILRCEDARQELQILINLHDISNDFASLEDKLKFIHCNTIISANETEIDSLEKVHDNLRWILVKEGTQELEMNVPIVLGKKNISPTKLNEPEMKKARMESDVIVL